MTTRRSWVQDYCEDSNRPADEQHAQGLLKLHETCTPACPRKLSAQRYLRERDADSEATDGASEW
ncbi:hypothetical protein [Nocardia gipuzkoensis]|uniref:hypothetical protein n=1 Tax=Nocardia gipuzkoensis TaxID=2749991 RepID=UPI00237DC8DD|nr:hypothetical protein [Nocardia gipuzkoensis]MDE1669276.1 hypothetical protein [Nocardia gipuzkoensis]